MAIASILRAPARLAALALVGFASVAAQAGGSPHPRLMQLDDLFQIHKVSDPQVSPDGRFVAFVVSDASLADNLTRSEIWVTSVKGGGSRPLTTGTHRDAHPRWSPNGRWLLFESDREGGTQLWVMPAWGGEARRITGVMTGAYQAIWAPDSRKIAFVSAVYPEFSERPFEESNALNGERIRERARSKVKAHVATRLLYRHWDMWADDRRQHLFVMSFKDGTAGEPSDVTPGDRDAVPTSWLFSAGDDESFSPDGTELAYTASPAVQQENAWSTNYDILCVTLSTGERRTLTPNPAADGHPVYSPDGQWIAYRAQTRPGFESDRWQLMVMNRRTHELRSLTSVLDASVGRLQWAGDSKGLYFDAMVRASGRVFYVGLDGRFPREVSSDGSNSELNLSQDGRWLVYCHQSLTEPSEIMALETAHPKPYPITALNEDLMAHLSMGPVDSVLVSGAGRTPVQMWVVKPPHFTPTRRYPVVLWVHGGPQDAYIDGWSDAWNPQLWAAQGYVVALPNPRGSTSFGQRFTDEVSRDWGGKPYEDLMACADWLASQPYVDAKRMGAAGASYGGYMINWFQGHTDRFKVLVTHDGIYNFESMYGTTDELWFDEWEHGIPWQDPDFSKFSPSRFAARFRTPTLVIHNELDYRVPLGEGQQLFTVLQRRGIPSKFLSFPDEGHWILKPQNLHFWHEVVFDWLAQYLAPEPP